MPFDVSALYFKDNNFLAVSADWGPVDSPTVQSSEPEQQHEDQPPVIQTPSNQPLRKRIRADDSESLRKSENGIREKYNEFSRDIVEWIAFPNKYKMCSICFKPKTIDGAYHYEHGSGYCPVGSETNTAKLRGMRNNINRPIKKHYENCQDLGKDFYLPE